ncbi:MAG: hypothetical protein ACFFBU_04955 [Promethearchaeota archaeon]
MASSKQRAVTKPITCPVCGHINLIHRKLYNWLLTKEKQARCRNCGRSIPLTA